MHEERGKFTFSPDLINRGVITGTIKSFPDPWEIPKIGKCRVHLFKPDGDSPRRDDLSFRGAPNRTGGHGVPERPILEASRSK